MTNLPFWIPTKTLGKFPPKTILFKFVVNSWLYIATCLDLLFLPGKNEDLEDGAIIAASEVYA